MDKIVPGDDINFRRYQMYLELGGIELKYFNVPVYTLKPTQSMSVADTTVMTTPFPDTLKNTLSTPVDATTISTMKATLSEYASVEYTVMPYLCVEEGFSFLFENNSPMMLVRSQYITLADYLIRTFNTPADYYNMDIQLTGDEGTGKTYFLYYFLYVLHHSNISYGGANLGGRPTPDGVRCPVSVSSSDASESRPMWGISDNTYYYEQSNKTLIVTSSSEYMCTKRVTCAPYYCLSPLSYQETCAIAFRPVKVSSADGSTSFKTLHPLHVLSRFVTLHSTMREMYADNPVFIDCPHPSTTPLGLLIVLSPEQQTKLKELYETDSQMTLYVSKVGEIRRLTGSIQTKVQQCSYYSRPGILENPDDGKSLEDLTQALRKKLEQHQALLDPYTNPDILKIVLPAFRDDVNAWLDGVSAIVDRYSSSSVIDDLRNRVNTVRDTISSLVSSSEKEENNTGVADTMPLVYRCRKSVYDMTLAHQRSLLGTSDSRSRVANDWLMPSATFPRAIVSLDLGLITLPSNASDVIINGYPVEALPPPDNFPMLQAAYTGLACQLAAAIETHVDDSTFTRYFFALLPFIRLSAEIALNALDKKIPGLRFEANDRYSIHPTNHSNSSLLAHRQHWLTLADTMTKESSYGPHHYSSGGCVYANDIPQHVTVWHRQGVEYAYLCRSTAIQFIIAHYFYGAQCSHRNKLVQLDLYVQFMNESRFCFNYFYMMKLHGKSAHLPMIKLAGPEFSTSGVSKVMLHYTLSVNAQRISHFSDSSEVDLDATGNTVYVSTTIGYPLGDAIAVATISFRNGFSHIPPNGVDNAIGVATTTSATDAAPGAGAVVRKRRGGGKKAAAPAVRPDTTDEKVLVQFQLTNADSYGYIAEEDNKRESSVWMKKARDAGIDKMVVVFVTANEVFGEHHQRNERYTGPEHRFLYRIDSLF